MSAADGFPRRARLESMTCDFPDCEKPVAFYLVDEDGDTVGYECEEHALEAVEVSEGQLRLKDPPPSENGSVER